MQLGSNPQTDSFIRRVSLVAVFAVALLGLAATSFAGAGVGDRAAEWTGAKDAKGRTLKLKSYKGKWVVVTFGASWCKPCKKELPQWDKLAAAYKAKGVSFVAVNYDLEKAKGEAFIKKLGIKNMTVAYDPNGTTVKSYDPTTAPVTFVIDPNGIIRHVHKSYYSGDEKKLAKNLDELLKK